jgi:molybdopterin-guanine dinucleotide biosynthesis protein A
MEVSARQPRAVSGAILAGGRARRFGGIDKSALIVGGRRIIDRQIEVLRSFTADVVVIGHPPERFAGLPVGVARDLVPEAGPLGGLYTALRLARTPLVLVLACDLPFVTARMLGHFVASIGDADVCLARDDRGLHALSACYAARCAPRLEERLRAGRYKVADAIDGLTRVEIAGATLGALDPTGLALTNVNTAADYAALLPPA